MTILPVPKDQRAGRKDQDVQPPRKNMNSDMQKEQHDCREMPLQSSSWVDEVQQEFEEAARRGDCRQKRNANWMEELSPVSKEEVRGRKQEEKKFINWFGNDDVSSSEESTEDEEEKTGDEEWKRVGREEKKKEEKREKKKDRGRRKWKQETKLPAWWELVQ